MASMGNKLSYVTHLHDALSIIEVMCIDHA